MVAWVVIDRQQPRQAGPFASLLSTPVIPLPHLSPLLPTPYGHSYTTATHQPLCNQFVTHSFHRDGGCTTPLLGASTAYALLPIHYLLSFQIRAHSFAFLCTFLRLPKTQLISFQAIPHSLQKTPGVEVGPQIPAFPDWLSSTASDKIASLPTPCRQMGRAIEESL